MKAVVGIDASPEALNSVRMLARLQLSQPELQLVHVIERLSPEEWAKKPQNANDLLTQFLRLQEKEGQQSLDQASALARDLQLPAESVLKYGSTVSNQLLQVAQNSQADLIAIGSRDESALGKLLIGSVGRKLVTSSPTSLLISRTELTPQEPVEAVFATDHSEYAARCVDTLLHLAPRGLKRLTIMTAYPREMVRSLRNFSPQVPPHIGQWLEAHLNEQNQKVEQQLKALGVAVQSRVIASDPDTAIEESMKASGSKLLIMGAQGHGFWQRLATGSHTFRQAVSGKHSVLILRARE
ncbi:MAG TPA: universal stress protein [Oligoflexus sp.]|uniref:universal stress protein n=1 Tax=Oligoflexus sp. TaxID=1971216 RepID=UPI002D80CC46|nr:universal stress protein [Oligoflexus sp.]HET9238669.1 universal stress protein [Oligoflexus sp.]